ncbi:hypothetical protein BIS05_20690 [Halomonas sp. BBD45]|nr:hypothetical protein [Halomonas sp. BBD45]
MLPRTEALERQIRAGAEPLMALDEEDFMPQG